MKTSERGVSLRFTVRAFAVGAEWNSALRSLAFFALAFPLFAADPPPKAPVPPSPYLPLVYRFADAMLAHGRDTYGPQKTGLFLSALDRKTLAPLTTFAPPLAGLRDGARVRFAGANLQHDENLLRLLYTLSELSSKPVYREAADGAEPVGLVRAAVGDRHGNLRFEKAARNFNPLAGMAGRFTIAEVDELVEPGVLDPDDIHLPGIYVDRVVVLSPEESADLPIEKVTTRPRKDA